MRDIGTTRAAHRRRHDASSLTIIRLTYASGTSAAGDPRPARLCPGEHLLDHVLGQVRITGQYRCVAQQRRQPHCQELLEVTSRSPFALKTRATPRLWSGVTYQCAA